jgi:hypothetical protein
MRQLSMIDFESVLGTFAAMLGTVYFYQYVEASEKLIVFILTSGAAISTIIYNYKKIKKK